MARGGTEATSGASAVSWNHSPSAVTDNRPPAASSRPVRFSSPVPVPNERVPSSGSTPSLPTRSRAHSPSTPASISQRCALLCRSTLVTASRSTIASTVSSASGRPSCETSTRARISATDSIDSADATSAASDMGRYPPATTCTSASARRATTRTSPSSRRARSAAPGSSRYASSLFSVIADTL